MKNSNLTPFPDGEAFKTRLGAQTKLLIGELSSLEAQCSNEKIHKIRVLTRRFRASLTLLDALPSHLPTRAYLKVLRRLTRTLGPVRSLDVNLQDLKNFSQEPGFAGGELDPLIQVLKKKRRRARQSLVQKNRDKKLVKKIKALQNKGTYPDFTPGEFFHELTRKEKGASDQLEITWGDFYQSANIKDLHRVRIKFKKWRYLVEIHSETLGAPGDKFLARLKLVQDRLGKIHDYDVLKKVLKKKSMKKTAKKHGIMKSYRQLLRKLNQDLKKQISSFHQEGNALLGALLMREVS